MAETQSPQTVLWREGWSACKRHAKELFPWVLAFAVLVAICNFYSLGDEVTDAYNRLQALEDQAAAPDHTAPMVVRLARVCATLIELVAFYCFTVLYLRREPFAARPQLSVGGFFGWLLQMAIAALCLIGLGLAVALIGGLIVAGVSMITHGGPSDAISMAIAVVTMIVFLYGAVKVMLVSPLTASEVAPAVKSSWRMTRGEWWRLAWGYLWLISIVWMILFGVFLLPLGLLFIYTPATAESPAFIGGLSVIMAFCSVTALAAGALYCCVACRVLKDEQGLPAARESGSIRT